VIRRARPILAEARCIHHEGPRRELAHHRVIGPLERGMNIFYRKIDVFLRVDPSHFFEPSLAAIGDEKACRVCFVHDHGQQCTTQCDAASAGTHDEGIGARAAPVPGGRKASNASPLVMGSFAAPGEPAAALGDRAHLAHQRSKIIKHVETYHALHEEDRSCGS